MLLHEPNGRLYTITDVKELHDWHVEKCSAHPMLERLPGDVLRDDPAVQAMIDTTERHQGRRNKEASSMPFTA